MQQLPQSVPAAYSPLIEQMKFYSEPNISCSRFFGMACFTGDSIAEYRSTGSIAALAFSGLGSYIAQHLQGGLFLDIPCGRFAFRDQQEDFDLIPLVARLGAARYWEVDIDTDTLKDRLPRATDIISNGTYQKIHATDSIGIRHECGLPIATMQDDLLGFLTKFSDEDSQPKTIYISALQPDAGFCTTAEHQYIAVQYLTAVYDELARICKAGDLVIVNAGTMLIAGIDEMKFPAIHPALALAARNFTLARRCAFNKVQVFRKEQ
ncbi:MAG: hypothetical protein JWM56_290 [Candidatus Peribacteria bacterium]|nr:hypothetical protein [Candidatus Peribacteria bacterium]